jgi:hypothetical protein
MALDVSTGFTAPRLAVMQPLSCSSFFRLPLQAGVPDGPTRRARDEHTSEERWSRLTRYSDRDLRLNETRLGNAVLTRF